ncbi:MAG: sugar ABC transporter permease, partial [Spirochaetes bacterium]|nr:sugar ABC transporter permease [Spirochaetota bacterium]
MSNEIQENGQTNFFEKIIGTALGRIAVSVIVPFFTFIILWLGFSFLRDAGAPRSVNMVVAIIWGVGGVLLLYFVTNWLVQQLPKKWRHRFNPYVFVGPALIILGGYLVLPTLITLVYSFF